MISRFHNNLSGFNLAAWWSIIYGRLIFAPTYSMTNFNIISFYLDIQTTSKFQNNLTCILIVWFRYPSNTDTGSPIYCSSSSILDSNFISISLRLPLSSLFSILSASMAFLKSCVADSTFSLTNLSISSEIINFTCNATRMTSLSESPTEVKCICGTCCWCWYKGALVASREGTELINCRGGACDTGVLISGGGGGGSKDWDGDNVSSATLSMNWSIFPVFLLFKLSSLLIWSSASRNGSDSDCESISDCFCFFFFFVFFFCFFFFFFFFFFLFIFVFGESLLLRLFLCCLCLRCADMINKSVLYLKSFVSRILESLR